MSNRRKKFIEKRFEIDCLGSFFVRKQTIESAVKNLKTHYLYKKRQNQTKNVDFLFIMVYIIGVSEK